MELFKQTVHQLHCLLQAKEVSAAEITSSVLERMNAVEGDVQAYITKMQDTALQRAKAVDAKIQRGEPVSPLAGIPGAIKDNICTSGVKTTCASKILAGFTPPYNATVMEKLGEDAVIVGKANLDEFAMGGSTENSAFQSTRNPWDLTAVPGGSSGGSAAAVAAGEAIWALGSDTGGSIRQPAAYCGQVGLKPTYGRVSRYGLVAFASSLDQIGPISRDVTDCAYVMNAIAGYDAKDSTSINAAAPDFTKALVPGIKGLKIGLPREYFVPGMDPEVEKSIRRAIDQLVALGAELTEISMPHTQYALSAYYLIAPAEASSNLARYDGVGFGHRAAGGSDIIDMYRKTRSEAFGPEVKRRIMLGTYALSSGYYDAYYLKALKIRTLVKQDFDRAFEKVDVLITPTAPTTAFKFGEKADDPLSMYLQDVCTIPVNLAGVPAISIPCGFSGILPIGLQIIGKPLAEETIIRTAYTFEQNNDYHKRFAPLGEVK
ncbi:Asp-tRNA(Asn)/Glu-tRNA(Gln) amidotransferase subunit GatA|uniref:Glutamyl-tRNA(Gln) amidotransferase subunit A n=1 Tax=Dendrosporobacter quercicolus TaxID=146817 RepID=A0A1G9NUK7_9FIRM|nr:Asp-tRNA(Asn)/Glu-tRNA(Gln) amidotransferase subunit GatA [Dendrosporobacter quercicolus]NSL47452.1 Asp-tRNA(Asn)/Glu-tRNA(Gln) amidotransferase subunit GatA [Dendrosporobacter quercicolus DSM 1736]SDL90054.1 aspartyl/glutamyl-tRNA(Asn/Gln) amidotransferase subunit A [Dendrosporobacter quercicolus]